MRQYLSKVDYDLWLGPAPKRAFNRNRFHYNWHWFWDTGNGDLGNQGIHEVDIARWGLGVTHPTKVSAIGGKFMFDDDQETPNTLSASFEFDVAGKKKMMTFEVRHWISPHEAGINGEKPGNTIGNQFYGSKGYLVIDNYNKYYSFMGKEQTPGPTATKGDEHYANFIDAVRSRKRQDLNAEVEEGALSCNLMHLANISYRLGRTLHWDAKTMTCVGDKEANELLDPRLSRAVRRAEDSADIARSCSRRPGVLRAAQGTRPLSIVGHQSRRSASAGSILRARRAGR